MRCPRLPVPYHIPVVILCQVIPQQQDILQQVIHRPLLLQVVGALSTRHITLRPPQQLPVDSSVSSVQLIPVAIPCRQRVVPRRMMDSAGPFAHSSRTNTRNMRWTVAISLVFDTSVRHATRFSTGPVDCE